MNYPLIADYLDSIRFAEDNFATLTNLQPLFDKEDNPLYQIYDKCVIFKMKDVVLEKIYCVKCFLTERSGRKEWYDELSQSGLFFSKESHSLENELFVDTNVSNAEEFPVFIYSWTENICLADYIQSFDEFNENLYHNCILFVPPGARWAYKHRTILRKFENIEIENS